ncbi:protein UXT-like isoform X3 [Poeciliopsis prolifica]|uniref:protein UXT-like isoform X3 n=1 Tax=Poeciliopsis prolifica TaxID=188132 RepID=UPI002413E940|nr:protein UXT-like isoform X3 [Poeciliopsis prolifica]
MTARPACCAGGLDQKVLQYEAFISDVLRRDLRAVLEQRDRLYEKMSHYLQLKNAIQTLEEAGPQRLKADVDLGCSFFVQARVDNPSRILVLVGFGFFVEMSHQEALRFIDKKTNQLTLFIEQLTKDVAKIKAHIRMVLEGLRELQGLEELPAVCRKSAAAAQL